MAFPFVLFLVIMSKVESIGIVSEHGQTKACVVKPGLRFQLYLWVHLCMTGIKKSVLVHKNEFITEDYVVQHLNITTIYNEYS